MDTRIIDELYDLALAQPDLPAAERAAQRRMELAHTFASRLMLAKVEMKRGELAPIVADLADIAKWRDPIDEHGEAWLLLCDATAGLGQNRQRSPVPSQSRCDRDDVLAPGKLIRRQKDLEERRAVSVKLKALTGSDSVPAP